MAEPARAADLARTAPTHAEPAAGKPRDAAGGRFLTFRVDGQLYALPAADVSEVILIPTVARLPHSPRCLMGLANLRGSVLPVVDVSLLLGRAAFVPTRSARGIVLTGSAPVALAVEAVDSLVAPDSARIETRQAELAAAPGELLSGAFQMPGDQEVAKILDLPALLRTIFAQTSAAGGERRGAAVTPAAIQGAVGNGGAREEEHLLVSFDVAGQHYALALHQVREITPFPEAIAIVPRSEAVLLGVTAYRDGLLPLLSLRGLLGFPGAESSDSREKVIVTPVGGGLVGLVADGMRAILRAGASRIDPAPAMLAARSGGESRITAVFRGENGQPLVSVLAPEHLFREDVMRRLGSPAAPASQNPVEQDPAQQDLAQREIGQYIVFRLGDEEFGLPIGAVDEVARVPEQLTRVPKTPKFLEGVINLRGEVLPVVDQRRRFDMPKFTGDERSAGEGRGPGEGQRLIVVRTERHRAGLIVDSVSEVLRFPAAAIGPAPDLAHAGAQLIYGVINLEAAGRIILLLEPSELLTRSEQGVLDKLDLTPDEARAASPGIPKSGL